MKFLAALVPLALAASVSSFPTVFRKRDVNADLIPQFGLQAGLNPTGACLIPWTLGNKCLPSPEGTGDCDGAVKGANGQAVKVPCACPPDRTLFIQVCWIPCMHSCIPHLISTQDLNGNVAAGHVLNNPTVSVSPSHASVFSFAI
jgi:hypothetical protein